MKYIKLAPLFAVIAFSISCNIIAAESVYISKDEFGNLVYSDSPPTDRPFKTIKASLIKTTNWEKVPPQKIKKPRTKSSKRKKSKTAKTTISRCSALKSEIKEYENKLGYRLEASEFDQVKDKLSEARWKYQKKC